MGAARELKFALERHWKAQAHPDMLALVAGDLRARHWLLQRNAGLAFATVGDFSLYDTMLDTSLMFGVAPQRFGFGAAAIEPGSPRYFELARATRRRVLSR